jgi:hypothetical protein
MLPAQAKHQVHQRFTGEAGGGYVEVIFPNNCGFLKSTGALGGEKPKLWNGFWKSKRNCRLRRSVIGKFFLAEIIE